MTYFFNYLSPIGNIQICTSNECIISLSFSEKKKENSKVRPDILEEAILQLNLFFNKKAIDFKKLKFSLKGTDLQVKVWNELLQIPFASTSTYKDIAKKIGKPKAVRAVASAIGKNPILIFIPCHRVIGSDGKLRGYAGGINKKIYLLNLEQGEI